MAIDPNIVTENLIGSNESENPIDTTITENDMMGAEELNPIPEEQPVFEEVEVAGRFTPKPKKPIKERIREAKEDLIKATDNAEEKLLPKGPIDNVTIEGDNVIVRALDKEELKNINEILPQSGSGVNFIQIVDKVARSIPDIDANFVGNLFENIKIKNKKLFDDAKRGTFSMQQMLEMAEKNGIIKNAEKWIKKKPGEILPAEDFLGGILTVVNWRTEVQSAYDLAKTINEPKSRELAMEKVARMAAVEQQLLANLSANLSEYGRGLAAVRNLGTLNLDVPGRTAALNSWVDSFDDDQTFEYMMEKYSVLPDSGKKVFLERSLAGRTLDAVVEGYVMGVLTSLRTHVVNIASTGLNNIIQIPVDIVSSGIGYARQSMGGTGERQYAEEFIYRAEGMRLTVLDALLLSGKSWIKDEPSDLVSKIDLKRRKSLSAEKFNLDPNSKWGKTFDYLGVYNRLSGRFLVAEDEFFKVLGAGGEARVLAFRRSMNLYNEMLPKVGKEKAEELRKAEFIKLTENYPQDIREDAEVAARYFAFQEPIPGTLGNIASVMAHPVVKIFGTAFVKTPTNVIGQTLQYTFPAGIPRVYLNLKSGDPIAADRALAKVAIGSTLMATLAASFTWNGGYGDNTFVTGGGPTEYNAREAWKRKGLLPYSFCSKDKDSDPYECVSYARFEPVSGILAIAADFSYYAQHEDNQGSLAELASYAAIAMAEYADSMPMLEGLSSITELFNNVIYPTKADKIARFGEMITEKTMNAVLAGTPGGGAFTRSVEAIINPDSSNYTLPAEGLAYPFDAYAPQISELSPGLAGFYRALQKYKAGNPYFSDKVPPKLNRWAEVMPQGNGEYREILSPIRRSYEKNGLYSKFDEEVMILGGDGIVMPSKKISGVKLNAVQYNQLLEIAAHIDEQGFLPAGVLGKDYDDVGYNIEQSLYNQLDLEMKRNYYDYKSVTVAGQTIQEETTAEEKLAYLNNIVRNKDKLAVYYLKEYDLELKSLINLRE